MLARLAALAAAGVPLVTPGSVPVTGFRAPGERMLHRSPGCCGAPGGRAPVTVPLATVLGGFDVCPHTELPAPLHTFLAQAEAAQRALAEAAAALAVVPAARDAVPALGVAAAAVAVAQVRIGAVPVDLRAWYRTGCVELAGRLDALRRTGAAGTGVERAARVAAAAGRHPGELSVAAALLGVGDRDAGWLWQQWLADVFCTGPVAAADRLSRHGALLGVDPACATALPRVHARWWAELSASVGASAPRLVALVGLELLAGVESPRPRAAFGLALTHAAPLVAADVGGRVVAVGVLPAAQLAPLRFAIAAGFPAELELVDLGPAAGDAGDVALAETALSLWDPSATGPLAGLPFAAAAARSLLACGPVPAGG